MTDNRWEYYIVLLLIIFVQVLAFISIITAAVCLGYLGNFSSLQYAVYYAPVQQSLAVRTQYAAGWVIFLSFWVIFYQCLAIVQLFLKVNIAYSITIPGVNWSLFFLLVSKYVHKECNSIVLAY